MVKGMPSEVASLAVYSIAACYVNTTILLGRAVRFGFVSALKVGISAAKSVCRESSCFAIKSGKWYVNSYRDRLSNSLCRGVSRTRELIESRVALALCFYQLLIQEILAAVNEMGTSLLHTGYSSVSVTYQPGDILYRRLKGVKGMFYHYGVYIGKKEVIQFMCGESSNNEGQLEKVSVEEFLDGNTELWIQNKFRFETKKKKEICKKAFEIYQLDEELEDWSEYNWRRNNCEHFANYCATGHKYSKQAII